MDFLDPKQKKTHTIRLYVGYVLIAGVVLCATWLLSYFSFGFNYDPKTKQVIQSGIVFADSHPESARVYINGVDKGGTDVRLVMPVGDYKIELKREGYRTWSNEFTLYGRSMERLIYPFMFPEKLVSNDAELFASTPVMASQSPDRRWLVTKHADKINDFAIVDLSAEVVRSLTISLDPNVLTQTGAKHDFSEVEWSDNNRHLLVKHVFDGGSEFILVDKENAGAAVNLNKHFSRPITDVRMRDKKQDQYYLHDTTNGDLVSANLSDPKITQAASRVLAFRPHGARIVLYTVASLSDKNKVDVMIHDGDKDYKLRELPKSTKYLLDLAEFDGSWYVAVGSSEDKRVYVYVDPFSDLKRQNQRSPQPTVLLRLNSAVEHLTFSGNTRFIAIQAGSEFAIFDAETSRQYRYDARIAFPKGYKVKWMDGHRLTAISENKLVIFDFDGTNKQELIYANPSFYPFFDRDYNKLYTISPSATVKDKPAIVMTSMRVDTEAVNN